MPAFELVRTSEAALDSAPVTRTLFIPDLDGSWRELRPARKNPSRPGSTGPRRRAA